ncbi:hypothetical protein ACEWY4_014815 [Coilia grayii]|uniref:5-hydroxytryptamine receptor 3A-like n=1 Tax=Coilia grayii TaxID=363190 RepID=A0ABD1JTF2_9TELE
MNVTDAGTDGVVLQSAEGLNCSEPEPASLLSALQQSVFNLSGMRPVRDLTQPTIIRISFTVYAILGVIWQNEFVRWDAEECGTHKITLPRSSSWNPDIVINELHPTLYVVNLLVPSCFLVTLDLFSFILPPQNVFFSICLALMVASLLETILITNLLHNSKDYPAVPRWVRFLILELLARLVLPPPQCPDVSETPTEVLHQEPFRSLERELRAIRQQMEKNMATNQNTEDWTHIGQVVDRFLFCVVLQSAEGLNCSNPDPVSLLSALKESVYNLSDIRPVRDLNQPVTIYIFFTVYGILGVTWQNEFVLWDAKECGTDKISLPRSTLWTPDIVINEFMEANTGPETYYVYLFSDGTVVDMFPMKVISSCNMDIYAFPFDIQNCSYSFNSYLHRAYDIQLNLATPIEAILNWTNQRMEMKGEWTLINMTSYHSNRNNSNEWDYLYIHLILKRHPTLYVVNLLVPSCFLITLDLFSFILPPQSVDRSAFKMTLILGYTVFLLLMNDLLPVTGNTIPLLNVFFSICLALMVASLLETILITNLLYNSKDYPAVPRWVRFLLLELLARLVCLTRKTPNDQNFTTQTSVLPPLVLVPPPQCPDVSETPTEVLHQEPFRSLERELRAIRQHLEKNMATDQNTEDWTHIGQVVDRFLFCVYLIFITTSFITILVIWNNWYKH